MPWQGIDRIFKDDMEPERVAAIVIEPVLGEGGYIPAPFDFIQQLRELCDRHGIVMVADEIQTGFGRTGRWFAVEHAGIEPDLVTMAKSLGGGFPISALTGKAEIMDAPGPGGLGGTYGASPISCAAALAVIDVIEEEGLIDRAQSIGGHVVKVIEGLAETDPRIGEVRGLGAMVGVEMVKDGGSREPDPGADEGNHHRSPGRRFDPSVLRHLRQRSSGDGAAKRQRRDCRRGFGGARPGLGSGLRPSILGTQHHAAINTFGGSVVNSI